MPGKGKQIHIKSSHQAANTVARVALSDKKVNTFHKNWDKHIPAKKLDAANKWAPILATLLILTAVLGLVLFFILFIKSHKKESSSTVIAAGESANSAVPEQTPEVTEQAPQQMVAEKPEDNVKPVKRDSLRDKIKAADEFYVANPEQFNEILARYWQLQRQAQFTDREQEVEEIAEKIYAVELQRDQKIFAAEQKIIAEINKELNAGRDSEAIVYLQEYSGPFAKETKRQRANIIRKIKEGKKVFQIQKSKSATLLFATMERISSSILEKRFEEAKAELKQSLQDQSMKPLVPLIRNLILNIDYFENIETNILKTFTDNIRDYQQVEFRNGVQEKIKVIEVAKDTLIYESKDKPGKQQALTYNQLAISEVIKRIANQKIKNDSLLRGLVYCRSRQFDKAADAFTAMPFETGYPFLLDIVEIETLDDFRKILKNYNLEYSDRNPEKLLVELTRKKISSKLSGSFSEN